MNLRVITASRRDESAKNAPGVITVITRKQIKQIGARGLTDILNDLPVANIKQVEIIRGPGSALYGANAFIAVINIITESGEEIDGAEFQIRFREPVCKKRE